MKTLNVKSRYKEQLWLAAIIVTSVFALVSCNNQKRQQKSVEDLKNYAQQHLDSADKYADIKWNDLENTFNRMRANVDKDTANLEEGLRADYNKAITNWDDFKVRYEAKVEEKRKLADMDALRSTLVIEGVRNDNSNLTSGNILKEYRYFLDEVSTHKDDYTKEQWTVINVSWKTLNGRRREISKDISKGDEAEIMKLQLKYTNIKALNRPFAETQ